MEISLFYVPCGSSEEASGLIKKLLDDKVIACGNIIPSHSIYIWDGSQQNDQEWIAVLKTLPELESAVQQIVQSIHTYDTPAIIHWTAKCNQVYYEWMTQTCKVP
ncbi:MAG: hypothetical protein RIR48_3132 [Bacteroidota bacterium]|jgi:periplasmic divalent cation tolerance protein